MDLLIAALRTNDQKTRELLWQEQALKPFQHIRAELTVTERNIVLRGTRLVIPEKARLKIVQLAHRGHQGVVKTKQLIREKVWFPGVDRMVETAVKNCEACQRTVDGGRISPLKMTPLPDGPWQSLAADFAGPLPGNKYLLVVVDEYSRFPVVATLSSLTAKSVTGKLNDIFTVHGLPYVLRTNNGPPFFSNEFAEFLDNNGIRHQKTTPLWPQGNGEVERFIKNVKKTVKAAGVQGQLWKEALSEYLLNYRATPHSTTAVTPAELLFGRKIRTKSPQLQEAQRQEKLRQRDRLKKAKMKAYADEKRHAEPHDFQEGESVLLKRSSPLSHESQYEHRPFTVTRVQGSAITAECGNKRIVRNASYFKRIPRRRANGPDEWDVTDDLTRTWKEQSGHVETPTVEQEAQDASNEPHLDSASNLAEETPQLEGRRYPLRGTRSNPPKRYQDFVMK
ncbi:uncharacterized protein K02A2.6-like [Ornithodoros turicata]|uniref:uncharacterized protein K02A2.6-like n=1 Tax=Ornithodoros turicata TaxID=34597 RepID=UPI0031389A5E